MHEFKYAKLWQNLGYLLLIMIVVLSLIPAPQTSFQLPSDKLNHFVAYGVLMGWFAQLYPRHYYWKFAGLFVLLGVLLEFLQGMTGYRFFEYYDMLANALGVLLGWLLCLTPLSSLLLTVERRFL